jgi:hypothetical protein
VCGRFIEMEPTDDEVEETRVLGSSAAEEENLLGSRLLYRLGLQVYWHHSV